MTTTKRLTITTTEQAREYLADRGLLSRLRLTGRRLIDYARAERRRETAAARKTAKSAPQPAPKPTRQPSPSKPTERSSAADVKPDEPVILGWRPKQRAPSAHVGIVGKRIDIEATYAGTYGQDGPVRLVRCQAGDDTIVWESPESLPVAQGAPLRIRAIVKEHAERRGEKLTVLDRVKVL